MSGINENGSGSVRSASCFDYIRSISSCIRNFPFLQCFLDLLVLARTHFVRSVVIVLSSALVTISWLRFSKELSIVTFLYALGLIICLVLTFIVPQGSQNKDIKRAHKEEKRLLQLALQQGRRRQGTLQQSRCRQGGQGTLQQSRCRQGGQGAIQQSRFRQGGQRIRLPPIRHQPEGAEEALGNPMEQREELIAAAPECRHVQEVPVDFHRAEEPSESSNFIEPASISSDESSQQAASSDSVSNLPQSSTDSSTKSTHSSHLDDVANDLRNDEPLQQTVPPDKDNMPQSSTDPSTKSSHFYDVTNEDLHNDEPLQQAVPPDSCSNIAQSSTDPSTKSTSSTRLEDVTNEELHNDEPLQQFASDSGSNLPRSNTDPSTQSTPNTPLDDVTNEEPTRTDTQE
ncbi:unnamed protein product [Larinioides sclopetarius]|uniref:Reticulon-like protein n=1 Tax=Larinioides sclopetarius TaxID=280406 RepID=A0AAV2B072_9ARAC